MDKLINRQTLFTYIQEKGISKQFYTFFCTQKIPQQLQLPQLTPEMINELCDKINEKNLHTMLKSESDSLEGSSRWKMGEFKLFIWVSVFYAYNSSIAIEQIKQIDLQFIQSFFPSKSILKLKYELLCLFRSQINKKSWQDQQIQLLKKLLQKQQQQGKKIQWKMISYNLYVQSEGKFFKTFGQCREMWINHLDQTTNKEKWTKEEDYKLLKFAQEENKSWSKISKKFNHSRTEHMVKNRYISLIKLSKRYNIRMNDRQAENRMIKILASKLQKQKKINSKLVNLTEKANLDSESGDKELICNSSEMQSQVECYKLNPNNNQKTYLKQWEELELIKPSCSIPNAKYNQSNHQIKNKSLDLDILDLSLCDFPKQLSSKDDLLQKLGCTHIQQIEQAFLSCNSGNIIQFY